MGRYKEIQGDVGRYSAAACMLDSSAVARRGCAVGTHAEMAAAYTAEEARAYREI